jgi:hypothetical protein
MMAQIKAMSSKQRGEALQRGTIEFPWDELDRLRQMKGTIHELILSSKSVPI